MSNGQIVDQPGRADHRCGDEAHFALGFLERLERRRIDQREIIDPGKAAVAKRGAELRAERSATGVPLMDRRAGRLQRAGQAPAPAAAPRTRDRRCARTARGRPARARSGRRRSRPEGRGRDHPADHGKLLEILLAEQGDVGPNGQSAAWRRRSRRRRNGRAAPRLPTAPTRRDTLTWSRSRSGRCPRPTASRARSQPASSSIRDVLVLAARIAAEILAFAELGRIDEDAKRRPGPPASSPRRPAPCARRGARPSSAPARRLPASSSPRACQFFTVTNDLHASARLS